jgi:hypothetical protein
MTSKTLLIILFLLSLFALPIQADTGWTPATRRHILDLTWIADAEELDYRWAAWPEGARNPLILVVIATARWTEAEMAELASYPEGQAGCWQFPEAAMCGTLDLIDFAREGDRVRARLVIVRGCR